MGMLAFKTREISSLIGVKDEEIKKLCKNDIIKIGKEEFISIFTLARLLKAEPEEILVLLEDIILAELIEETEGDELLEKEQALAYYRNLSKKRLEREELKEDILDLKTLRREEKEAVPLEEYLEKRRL